MRDHLRSRNRRSGLTLIEMIATVAILGSFMTLLGFHLVGLSNLWLNRTNDDFFEQHVDGVVLFLNKAIEASEASDPEDPEADSQPVEWARPPGWSDLDDPLLHFRQPEAPALFVREGLSLPAVMTYIHFDRDTGLSLLWYSVFDAEDIEEVRDLMRTPVSSFVSRIEYAYYDLEDDEWELEEDPLEEDDAFLLPDFLKLTFSHPIEGDRTRSVFIPHRSLNVPLF
ncbi:MAG TPA: prepilin-type N-terminal cleavage/methylation domain-containing protein [Oceanipulchritudo sp.]|nr:prepilin-type N-terminal cleavage/methylation domain-containing protein [Oceanipulchritudo sp.]